MYLNGLDQSQACVNPVQVQALAAVTVLFINKSVHVCVCVHVCVRMLDHHSGCLTRSSPALQVTPLLPAPRLTDGASLSSRS